MPYTQVLYRKWRPERFADLAGQQHAASTIKRAISSDQVAHAYLFTGPRGVGKTSCARIFAKALNCLSPSDGEPDGECENCLAIAAGRFLDFVEIDAASNRSIESIKELIGNIRFRPISARRKIYVIDEAHMLTEPAFNALLKTLEEPPPHVVLALATTDAHKLPATIISRCQRYDFKRIPSVHVVNRLRQIAEGEGFECEESVLLLVAQAAWGSLRDAENMLEQLWVSATREGDSKPRITETQARDLLGLGEIIPSRELASALLSSDISASLSVINAQAEQGANLEALRNGTLECLRVAMLIKSGIRDAIGRADETVETMTKLSKECDLSHILRVIITLGETSSKGDSSSPFNLELAVLRSLCPASVGPTVSISEPPASARAGIQKNAQPKHRISSERETSDVPSYKTGDARWRNLFTALREAGESGDTIRRMLTNVLPPTPKDGVIELRFRQRRWREDFKDRMENQQIRQLFKRAIISSYGEELKMRLISASEEAVPSPTDSASDKSSMISLLKGMGAIEGTVPVGGSEKI